MSLVVSTVYSEFLMQTMLIYPSKRFEAVMRPFVRLLP